MTTCTKPISVLFVCTGNICRSPMAEAVFQNLVNQAGLAHCFQIASAATSTWEIGKPPHPGTLEILRMNEIPQIAGKRARQITHEDTRQYDYVLVMDEENVRDMHSVGPSQRLMEYAPHLAVRDIPDPYYTHDFGYTYRLVTAACKGLLEHIRAEHGI